MAVLSTLKVLEKAVIRKERKLPTPGEVLVSEGDAVTPDTLIAKAEYVRGNPHVIDQVGTGSRWILSRDR